ncbi:MAG TPA: hypothetical protein VKO43_01235, partial [Candidatus Krumholzibacteriaceae bacterium]|nr:hypothetical protein [Candidatus Krumholzibacteriaceae bacterium]
IEVKNGNIILGFDSNNRFAREMVSESKNRRYIENHLEKFFGRKLTIEVIEIIHEKEKKKKTGKKKVSIKKRKDTTYIDKFVENEPMAKRLIEEFDGEIYGENNKNGRTER